MTHHANTNYIPPYINGKFVPVNKPENTFSLLNPAHPSDILAMTGWSKSLVQPVLDGLGSAHKKLCLMSVESRLNLVLKCMNSLKENADEIKSNMMLELSRSRVSVEEEWNLCEKLFEALPLFCKKALSPKKETDGWEWCYAPLGHVLISTNIALPVYSLLASALPALIAGNAVCVRPSSHCVLSGSLLASSFHQAALPEGAIHFIYGDFEVFRRYLLTHQFDTVLFAGIEENLEQIRRDTSSQHNVRLVLCGGGKNAAYVSEHANLDKTIPHLIYGACVDGGQRLESTSVVFVNHKILNPFLESFVSAIKKMPIGVREDGNRPDTHVMGPLCSVKSWERFLRFQGIAARESQETLRWGKHIDNPHEGFFVSPGVHLMPCDKVVRSIYASNAFFGPDVCIVPIEEEEEVISVVDSLSATRSLGIHSEFPDLVTRLRSRCRVPSLLWNTPTTQLNPLLPSIGLGNAGSSYVTGLRFLLSTVYPQTLNLSPDPLFTEGDHKGRSGK